jgi:hypothetical protein
VLCISLIVKEARLDVVACTRVSRAIHPSASRRVGVGASQAKCTDLSGITYCGKLLQSNWWAVWFNFFLLVAVFIMVSPAMH